MRLINTRTMALKEFLGDRPAYAILSHCWGEEELTFQHLQNQDCDQQSLGYRKVQNFCNAAYADYNLEWGWVDTCCIDKSSLTELSGSINSMFRYYAEAFVCLVYLVDLTAKDFILGSPSAQAVESWAQFSTSRWWTRGWTLQELIAPLRVVFLSQDWEVYGVKSEAPLRYHDLPMSIASASPASGMDDNEYSQDLAPLVSLIEKITGIPEDVLRFGSKALSSTSVAQRFSFAARRQTTREEDLAYCLLGILDVNMPLLYGEGGDKAWLRLQQEVIRTSNDESIFAWESPTMASGSVLSYSVQDFAGSGKFECKNAFPRPPYSMGNQGLNLPLEAGTAYVLDDIIGRTLAIPLNCVNTELHDYLSYTPLSCGIVLRERICGHYDRVDFWRSGETPMHIASSQRYTGSMGLCEKETIHVHLLYNRCVSLGSDFRGIQHRHFGSISLLQDAVQAYNAAMAEKDTRAV